MTGTIHEPAAATEIPAPVAWWRQEDWLAVWLGSAILVLVVSGAAPAMPPLRWKDAASASSIFSFAVLGSWMLAGAAAWALSTMFSLAFVSIGLETNLTRLVRLEEGRPLACFVCAQAFNVAWTLLLAWLIFGGVFLPAPAL